MDWAVGSQMDYQVFGLLGYRIEPALWFKPVTDISSLTVGAPQGRTWTARLPG